MDDGSSDGTAESATACAAGDPRISVIRQGNAGVSAARNRGLTVLEAPRVLFLDADDWLAPDALLRLGSALDAAPGAVAAYGEHRFVREGPPLTPPAARKGDHCKSPSHPAGAFSLTPSRVAGGARNGRLPPRDLLLPLLERNPFANGGQILIRTEAIRRIGGFRPELRFGEDYECWIRLAAAGPFAGLPDPAPVLFVRQQAGGAYDSGAAEERSYRGWMEAVFADPGLRARFGPQRVAALRHRADAENRWIIGRERVRRGALAAGLAAMLRSWIAKPSLRRAALLALAALTPTLPDRARGPFRAVADPGRGS